VHSIDLAGTWEYVVSDLQTPPIDVTWNPIDLPASWWLAGLDTTGPVWFRRRIEIPDEWTRGETRLVFEAVDYQADVFLDERRIGGHIGGFAPFDLRIPTDAGAHLLQVRVDVLPDEFGSEFPHTKRALRGVLGHHDARPGAWGPRGQERCAGGIWGPVSLRHNDAIELVNFGFTSTIIGADANVQVRLRLQVATSEPVWATLLVQLEGEHADSYELWTETWLTPGEQEVVITGFLAGPHLWWTWDHGDPHLYRASISVLVDEGEVALGSRSVGIRQIDVDAGWRWTLNGRPLFVRGSNYIGSQWLSGLTSEQTSADVRSAVDANLNMLRAHAHVTVPSFYDACDRTGVLVWQDLPMQWGYRDTAETYVVARQMVGELIDLHGWRPSVAFWCAHNESPWNEPRLAEEAGAFTPDQNQRLDHELAALFRRLDPSRPALANSGAGDGHTYPGWYWGSWTDVHELPGGALVSEYGAQAVPALETLRRFLPEGSSADDWAYHGFQHYENEAKAGVTWDMPIDEVIERTQRYQALIIQNSTETYRRKKRERVQGVLQFMLVDPWPCISWSVLDIERRPKLGYEALRRSMQPVLPSIEADGNSHTEGEPVNFGVWWINDHPRSFRNSTLTWSLHNSAGTVLDTASTGVHLMADDARRVMQAGPFLLAPGSYLLRTSIRDVAGKTLGENEYQFTVTRPE